MPIGLKSPNWDLEKYNWPYAKYSHFIRAGSHRWHRQRMGTGAKALLIHGTGASSHSFAPLVPYLTDDWELFIPDLPNHGFTQSSAFRAPSPASVAEDLAELLRREQFAPDIIVGHSAGAVVAYQISAMELVSPRRIVSLNGAFKPFGGLARFVAPVMAKAMYYNPCNAMMFARSAGDRSRVRRLIEQTGSKLTDEQIDLYARLLNYSGHISGTLGLMANWSLDEVEEQMITSKAGSLFIVGDRDGAVPPSVSEELHKKMPGSNFITLAGLGHLAHEEEPSRVSAAMMKQAEALFAHHDPMAATS